MIPIPHPIDLATYPRADILRAFMHRQMPQISVTCEVDVTAIRRGCDAAGVSFFLGMSHAVSRAVHAVPQFRHRVIDGTLCEYDRTDPGYTVAREADAISLHAPATNATRHIIGRAFLAQVKPTLVLVNTARGPLTEKHGHFLITVFGLFEPGVHRAHQDPIFQLGEPQIQWL